MISIEDLRKLPKLAEFRFGVELTNYEDEVEDVIAALVNDVVETNKSVEIKLWIPEPASTGYIASLLTSLRNISLITISHKRSNGTTLFQTLHRVVGFENWKIEGHADEVSFTPLTVTYATEVSFPVTQPVEGLNEWLKTQGDKE